MLFLNISTDQIYIQIEQEKIHLDRNEIEDLIWPKLVELYRKYQFKTVFLVNWPWGFTNLRVGTLALNLLNSLENWNIDVYSITKTDLFKHFVEKKGLNSKWIIYIWQKKNVWLYDFNKWDYETIKKDEIDYNDNLFFDLVYEKWYFEKNNIDIYTKDEKIIININDKELSTTIEELKIKPEKIIEAKYFIQPIMWSKWQ